MMKSVFWFVLFSTVGAVRSFDVVTGGPPLLNVPVYALATKLDDDDVSSLQSSKTNMHLLTYATPISIRPNRLWAIGLYKETYSYEIFKKTKQGILQLLTPEHIPLIRLLGGSSGRNVDKEKECSRLDCEWKSIHEDQPRILPGCSSYLLLELETMIDGGSTKSPFAK